MWGQLRLRSLPPADLTHPEMTKSDNGPTQNGLTLLVLLEKLYLIERYWIIQWCPEEDSNLHALRHTDLNRARLPIPPSGHGLVDAM